ncbi:MAG TPA: hypothetical protein RMH99_04235 [Sandaracinaceae bacterium LLY-WYZ-13_1]|nr:hypothetical protein [Sandaracinaceae bacterium LLY-WYZ-13_1]
MTRANHTSHAASLLLGALILAPAAAAAQPDCFGVEGQGGERAQHLVGLDDAVRVSSDCEYALAPGGPFAAPGALAGRDTDFAEIYRQLAAAPGVEVEGDPRVVVGRPAGRRGAAQQTLMLRYCAHFLLEEQLGFRVVPEAGGGSFRIERVRPAGCDADALELRAVRGARATRLSDAAAARTLGARQSSLELEEGDWSIYAARPGGAVGLRIGVFRSQRVVTPLQNHLRTVGLAPGGEPGAPALLAARWSPDEPGMLLAPTDHARTTPLLWSELRTAADAGLLWVARRPDAAADAPPTVLGLVQLEATEPSAVRLPDTAVREYMRETYGEAGDALVPSPADWRAIFERLAVCMTPNYHDGRTASIGGPVPDADACAALGGLAVFAQAEATEATPARFCVEHGRQRIEADGVTQALGEPECFALPAPDEATRPPFRVAVAGDRMTLEGDGLCVLIDDEAIAPEEQSGEYVLRSGLLEIRQGGGAGCTSRQAVARLRMPVLDPQREWHPVGLYAGASEDAMRCGGDEADEGGERALCPWRALPHDESDVFGFVEARQQLEFRLSASPQVAAVIGAEREDAQLTRDVPVLGGVRGDFEGAPAPAVVAWVSRDRACPTDTPYAELRARPPVDADALLPDSTFHVHLLSVGDDDAPPACLAVASFRVRPSRALVNETVADFLGMELGLLGDAQAVFFANEPVALGLSLPLVWFRMTPGQRWLSLEVAGNLVMAGAFEPCDTCGAALSRVGVSLSWALQIGIPEYVPRLLSVGGMLHGAFDTRSATTYEQPIVSFYVGLNLASLVDLAGGR